MKITLESTSKVVDLEFGLEDRRGRLTVPARIWEGQTDSGIPVVAFITRISPDKENPPPEMTVQFEAELRAVKPPRPAGLSAAIPLRLIL